MALADTAKLVASLELQDKFTGPANKINRSLSGLERGFSKIGRGTGQLAAGLGRIGVIGATVVAGGFATAVKLAGDFEAQLNTINTIVKLNDRDLKALGEGIRQTFRDTGQPLADLTSAYYDLLSAGIKVEDAQSLLNTSVKLGIGGLATTEEAVNLLTTAVNAYGLNASGATKAADIFAAAVRDGKVTVAEISSSFADVAPLAAQFGIKLEEVGAAYAVLTARGVLAAEVGTQFNRSLIEGLKPGPQLTKVLDGLGESFEDLLKQKGLVETLEDIRIEAQKQGVDFEDLFGRVEAYKFALATTGPNLAAFRREQEKMGVVTGEVNAQFAERQQGLNFQLAKLKALAQDAGITIGNALLPKLVPLVSQLNDFIQKNQGKIAQFAEDLAEGFSAFAKSVKDADFSGAIATLKILGEVGKKVVDIFLSLPPGVQAAIVAGAAVNKLSGGLLGAGAGNILGGVGNLFFDRFLARGSSAANPVWVQSAIGAPGGGGGPGGIFGGGNLLKGLLGVTLFTGLAIAIGELVAQNVTRPLDPTKFDFNQVAGQSGRFTTQQAAERFAQTTADKLGVPLDELKAGIVSGVTGGMTFDQAVAAFIAAVKPQVTHPGLPPERVHPGGAPGRGTPHGVHPGGAPGGGRPLSVKLPDTAMSDLSDTATATEKLAPIISKQERQIAALNDRMREVRAAQLAGNSTLGRIESKPSTVEVQVNVVSNITVSDTLRKITSSLIASGKVAGLPLG